MNLIEIPFNHLVGVTLPDEGVNAILILNATGKHLNHLGTVHASAQLTLAEAASGQLLWLAFPDLIDTVVPVVRRVEATFRRPAGPGRLWAKGAIPLDQQAKFLSDLTRKGRALLAVSITVVDASGTVTLQSKVVWYIQSRMGSPASVSSV